MNADSALEKKAESTTQRKNTESCQLAGSSTCYAIPTSATPLHILLTSLVRAASPRYGRASPNPNIVDIACQSSVANYVQIVEAGYAGYTHPIIAMRPPAIEAPGVAPSGVNV